MYTPSTSEHWFTQCGHADTRPAHVKAMGGVKVVLFGLPVTRSGEAARRVHEVGVILTMYTAIRIAYACLLPLDEHLAVVMVHDVPYACT